MKEIFTTRNPEGSASKGSLHQRVLSPGVSTSGRYASYCNAFLCTCVFTFLGPSYHTTIFLGHKMEMVL